jgi:hypothetical protein
MVISRHRRWRGVRDASRTTRSRSITPLQRRGGACERSAPVYEVTWSVAHTPPNQAEHAIMIHMQPRTASGHAKFSTQCTSFVMLACLRGVIECFGCSMATCSPICILRTGMRR